MRTATENETDPNHEPLGVTLSQLLEAIGETTQNDDEIAATLLYMVETQRVRLIEPALGA